jgi:hypothetical protein
MMSLITFLLLTTTTLIVAQPAQMSFFVVSENPGGKGGNLGGLNGADAHCTKLAAAGNFL